MRMPALARLCGVRTRTCTRATSSGGLCGAHPDKSTSRNARDFATASFEVRMATASVLSMMVSYNHPKKSPKLCLYIWRASTRLSTRLGLGIGLGLCWPRIPGVYQGGDPRGSSAPLRKPNSEKCAEIRFEVRATPAHTRTPFFFPLFPLLLFLPLSPSFLFLPFSATRIGASLVSWERPEQASALQLQLRLLPPRAAIAVRE